MIRLPLLEQLAEARQVGWKYTEKRVKGALSKVTLELEGNDSGVVTRLAKRYDRLDKSAKLLKEKRDELNLKVKDLGDQIFDVEDSVASRIIETVSYTMMLTAAEKAENKAPKISIDFESAFAELAKLVPELTEQVDAIRAKYTELIPAKDTPTALRVKSKIQEGLGERVKAMWFSFVNRIKAWCSSYDNKLATLKKKYPVKKARIVEADQSKLKAYKIITPAWDIDQAQEFVEAQDVCTIENVEVKGSTMYLYPHCEDKFSEKTHAALQKAADKFSPWIKAPYTKR